MSHWERVLSSFSNQKKKSLKCWGCIEQHLLRDYPYKQHHGRKIFNVQDTTTINETSKSVLKAYEIVENQHADPLAAAVGVGGKEPCQKLASVTNYKKITREFTKVDSPTTSGEENEEAMTEAL